MRMHTLLRGALLSLAVLMMAGPALAKGPRMPTVKQVDRLSEELGLDATTQEKLKTQIKEARATGKAKRKALKNARKSLKTLLNEDNPNRSQVMAQIDKVGMLTTAMQKHKLGAILDVYALLTPSQRKALRTRTRSWKKRHGRKGKRGRKGRRGKRRQNHDK